MKKLSILLTGASGTVGFEVLKQLSCIPAYKVTVFDIGTKKTAKIFSQFPAVDVINGDISNPLSVQKIPENFDIVIHLAALIPPVADKFPELTRRINVEGTRYLLNHIEKTSPQTFFMYSSSVSVYGDRLKTPMIKTTDDLNISEGDIYGQSKMDAELIVRNSNVKWTVFRLAAIMKNHKVSRLMFHMPLKTQLEICTPEDTALAFINAIEHTGELNRRIFNLGGGASCCITYVEFLERSFKIFGLGKVNFPAHAFAERNFHCGRMSDSDVLENILHFRKENIDSYFEKTAATVSRFKKAFVSMLSSIIKWILLQQSEPYKAWRSKNRKMSLHFFGTENYRISKQFGI